MAMEKQTLGGAWLRICDYSGDLGVPPSRWREKWSTHDMSAKRLHNAIHIFRPRRILETGTFEGLGTWVMAKALASNGGGEIITIDYDGDPEVAMPDTNWRELDRIRAENLDRARRDFPRVSIEFIKGDSRKVLPDLFPAKWDRWDLFFQDSMHFASGIRAEWDIVRPFADPNALVVFDDVCLDWWKLGSYLRGRDDFCLHFAIRQMLERRWRCRSTADGRAQLWAQRRG